jgi:hypothetical protein
MSGTELFLSGTILAVAMNDPTEVDVEPVAVPDALTQK